MSIEIVLAISAFLLVIPVLITRWLWFWVFSLVLGLPMVGVWVVYFYQTSQPEYSGSPQEFFGILIMVLISGSLTVGMFLRYIRWVIGLKVHEIKAAKALGSGGPRSNT
ncbi:hypothetical protein [Amphritea pacifica]|uniref:Uncharacterized protein n=1 Tax=Amphritea pacifica TaxID=2811233 RepID=A0ABS2WDR6_9GAMM|nr:hypothetical protein [Amphritea pacifica]MBN0989853.1 hypothetical protein [Amphritea pacifica]